MSLSDCPQCWDTPCTCGYGYRNMTLEQRVKLAAAILDPPYEPSGFYSDNRARKTVEGDEPQRIATALLLYREQRRSHLRSG